MCIRDRDLTLSHVDAFEKEIEEAGVKPDCISPMLLPTYTHGSEKHKLDDI